MCEKQNLNRRPETEEIKFPHTQINTVDLETSLEACNHISDEQAGNISSRVELNANERKYLQFGYFKTDDIPLRTFIILYTSTLSITSISYHLTYVHNHSGYLLMYNFTLKTHFTHLISQVHSFLIQINRQHLYLLPSFLT